METDDSSEQKSRQKQAACFGCRKSKVKCIRSQPGASCRKCETLNIPCIVPAYHVGRYKGVKNKHTGLDKAIHQVEKAIQKSKNGRNELDSNQTYALEQLLRSTGRAPDGQQSSGNSSVNNKQRRPQHLLQDDMGPTASVSSTVHSTDRMIDTEEMTVNNADNPLQLLAIASAIPETASPVANSSALYQTPSDLITTIRQRESSQKFFQPIRSKLDLSIQLDPIHLGLATASDAKRLFGYFYQRLAHARWGMDPVLHTWKFVRSRSAFLFASVMAASALFLPDTAALSIRLRHHVNMLVRKIVSERYRSVEIVLGFMINIPWMSPGQEWASEDDTCYYLSLALTMAIDLSLHRVIVPDMAVRSPTILNRPAKAENIDASKALAIDAFEDVESTTEIGRRLLRTRERTWLALFNLDRGVCLARGRPTTVPTSPLVDLCDIWHVCDIAEAQDAALVSATVLRRDFVGLINSIRATCDNNLLTLVEDSMTVRSVRDKIELFFQQWYQTWQVQIQQIDGQTPPYIEILASHTKLSAYCSVINHPTAPVDVRKFFRAAGLASALTVLKVAVLAESRLHSMPNNTVIMVTFAAFFVLGLSNGKAGDISLMAPSTRTLIEEVARVLEYLGSTPAHRQGASYWFGKHILEIVKQSATESSQTHFDHGQKNKRSNPSGPAIANTPRLSDNIESSLSTTSAFEKQEYIGQDFSIPEMTNDQIIEAIASSTDPIDAFNSDFVYDEAQFMDWFETWV